MTHSLPYNGRFLYLTETLRLSQYNGQQGLPEQSENSKLEILTIFDQNERKNWNFHKIWVKSFKFLDKNCFQSTPVFSKMSLIRF